MIIEETSSASWTSELPSSTVTASCDNGFGSPTTPLLYGAVSSGVRYTKKSVSGNTFTVSCSPKSDVSTTATPTTYTRNSVGVTYQAKIVTSGIVISGVTRVGNGDQLVVGQGCKPQLIYGSGITGVSGVAWTFSGGKPFKSYVVPRAVPDVNTTGTLNPIDAGNREGVQPTSPTHFAQDESVTISCTATATFANGSTQSLSPSVKLSVVAPQYLYKEILGAPAVVTHPDGSKYLAAAGPGIQYTCWVLPPPGFAPGEYSVMQLVNAKVEFQTPDHTDTFTTNGTFQLDGLYPYKGWRPDSTPPASLSVYGFDSPDALLEPADIRVSIDDTFKTFLMYFPATNNLSRQTVPLSLQGWQFKATASRATLADPWDYSGLSLTAMAPKRTYDHPIWQKTFVPAAAFNDPKP